jgi:type VI secretion system protein ImpM
VSSLPSQPTSPPADKGAGGVDVAEDPRPGWFGKLPTLGDFAKRRLPADFVEAWDDWLAHEIAAWQAADPAGWLERYLAGASWRFLLLPGAVPGWHCEDAMAGVLMPSVDRVGRYFPFTIGWVQAGTFADVPTLQRAFAQLHQLDDLALDALQEDWSVDRLEEELGAFAQRRSANGLSAGSAALDAAAVAMPTPGRTIDLPWRTEISATLADLACSRLIEQWHGGALWWSEPQPGRTRLRLSAGLPRGDDFIALFEAHPAQTPAA